MYDEYEEAYERYPTSPPRRRFSIRWKIGVLVLLAVTVAAIRLLPREPPPRPQPPTRRQVVKVVNWQAVDGRIRTAVEAARQEATRHAISAVALWVRELRDRINNDFLDWYFNYWNQQSLALKAVGYHIADIPLVEAIVGEQPAAETRLEELIESAFAARVLQPQSAQLRVEKMTRESVEIYLLQLSQHLNGLQAEFGIPPQQWDRHLQGIATLAITIEGNRQIPIITKAAIGGGGVAFIKIAKTMMDQVRNLTLRVAGREMLGDGMALGGKMIRGSSWWLAAGITLWDVVDHHRTVVQNLPVLRRSLNSYLDELEQQILHDPEVGIIQTLEGVQRDILRELSKSNP